MKRSIILLATIVAFALSMTMQSCKKDKEEYTSKSKQTENSIIDNINGASSHQSGSNINIQIHEGQIMYDVYDASSYIMQKCVNSSVDIDELDFYNPQVFCNQIGISLDYYIELNEQIKNSLDSIKILHPEISTYTNSFTCETCEQEEKIEKIKNYIEYFRSNNSTPVSAKYLQENRPSIGDNYEIKGYGTDCSDHINYTICLIVCTASGPYIYWLCAYTCLCHYCPQFCIQF